MFTKACENAIRAVLIITNKGREDKKLSIQQIAKAIDSPLPFTAKILQTLSREGLVESVKGPNGGFYIDPKAKPITLSEVIRAMDEESVLTTCALGLKKCSDKQPCPIHHQVKAYKNQLSKVLHKKTVQDLAKDLTDGKTFLRSKGKVKK